MAMTDERVIGAFCQCLKLLRRRSQAPAVRNSEAVPETEESFGHIAWMCEEGVELIHDGRREKSMRWLGYIQGVLFWAQLATIEDLKNMNRPSAHDND